MPQDIENRIKKLEALLRTPDFELKQANILKTAKDLSIKEVFSVTNNEVGILKGQRLKRTAFIGSNYTLATSDFLLGITSLALAPSIGLPDPRQVGVGKRFVIKDEVGGAATTTITVRSENERTIDGATTSTLTTNYQARSYYSDGSNWFTM